MGWPGYEKFVPAGVIRPDGRVQRTGKAKYGNRKTSYEGLTFDSAKECRRWQELKMLEKAGTITGLRRQVRFPLEVNGQVVAEYVSDFLYQHGGKEIVEDVKSAVTRKLPAYRLKYKLMLACYGIEISEV